MKRLNNLQPHIPPRKCFSRKLVRSGNVVEVYDYEEPVLKGGGARKGRAAALLTSAEVKQDNRRKTANRARQKVCRTINANPALDKFLTLTFAENVTDLDRAWADFNRFTKRLSFRFGHIRYVCVIEFQTRGAVHFHLVCDLPFVDVNALAKVWGKGFIKLNRTDNAQNVGAYVSKYMTKENMDERLIGRKCYSMSHGLNAPEVLTDEEAIAEELAALEDVVDVFTSSYESEYYGVVTYTRITCRRRPEKPSARRKSPHRGTGASPCIQPKRRA